MCCWDFLMLQNSRHYNPSVHSSSDAKLGSLQECAQIHLVPLSKLFRTEMRRNFFTWRMMNIMSMWAFSHRSMDLWTFKGSTDTGLNPTQQEGELNMGLLFKLLLFFSLLLDTFASMGDCHENEFLDRNGSCQLCKECGPGQELTKDCGFGVGTDAQCVTCRSSRYKDGWGPQKCKRCLSCTLVNRFQEKNCTVSSNTVCGKCLPGFYRKTRLGGLLDMECIPCSSSVIASQSQCISRTNIVSSDTPPYNSALVAVICSALTTVLLAALLLCVIYCRRLIAAKQSNGLQRPPQNERAGEESSSSEAQMGDQSTEDLKFCQNANAENNAAQLAVSTERIRKLLQTLQKFLFNPSFWNSAPGSSCSSRDNISAPSLVTLLSVCHISMKLFINGLVSIGAAWFV
ncbi:tumor necrosis factor receptor superfamily member 27 isoform X2 [Narcine bancroftii]|uniref:tumor necrosis factor receptor superfamily member 27 isoform X2 n=1 Tax=Narcine bancroftii TaxID=1343680 RepID=UPI0038310A1E